MITPELQQKIEALAKECDASESYDDKMAAVVLFALLGANERGDVQRFVDDHVFPFVVGELSKRLNKNRRDE